MHITSFDRHSALNVKTAIERKLKEIEDELGVTIAVNKIKLSSTRTMIMDTAVSIGKELLLEETEQGRAFAWAAERAGISKDALGQTFYSRGVGYKVTGWKSANFKYPVLCERIRDGQEFKFPISTIVLHFPAKR
ncbi:MAG: hypothetical protein LPK02_07235 [Rhodobacterales bacterium]|nr:hypothetical protein [Rhodobacterales bacterium]